MRTNMQKEKLICIGNGMAGIRTIEELLAIDPHRYEITVFGAEPYNNYNRILLSPVLAGEKTLQDIVLNDEDWYWQNGSLRYPDCRKSGRKSLAYPGTGALADA